MGCSWPFSLQRNGEWNLVGWGFVQPALSGDSLFPMDGTGLVALQLWSWQNVSGEGRSDGKNAGGCRRSSFRLPVENVFFPSPPLPTSFSKFSYIALCSSLRYSFQGNIDTQTDGTLHMLKHPKYKLLIEFLFAERAFRSCLFTPCEMAQCPHMQTGNIPAWLLS